MVLNRIFTFRSELYIMDHNKNCRIHIEWWTIVRFFPTTNCYVSAFNRSHRDRSGGKGLESFWESLFLHLQWKAQSAKPSAASHMEECVHEPLHGMFSCAHSQRSSLKNNTVSLVHSEALLLCNHLDVPGVSDSKKCLLAAWKGGSASSFADSRKCSSSASLKQNENFFLYVFKLFANACIRQDLQQQTPYETWVGYHG